MKSIKTFGIGLTLLAAALSSPAQTKDKVKLPQLAGTECIRNVCLGDELAKFAPGELLNRQATQINAWGRKTSDVLKDIRPLYGRSNDQTLQAIAQEHLRTSSPVVRVPLTPEIHEALITDKVQVCGFATLWAEIEGRAPETWSLVFAALPGQQIEGRQAWVLTDITVKTPGGLFAEDDLMKLRADLAKRASHPAVLTKVAPSAQALTVSMRWDPIGTYTVKDPSIGTLSQKTRLLFGCRSADALPSF